MFLINADHPKKLRRHRECVFVHLNQMAVPNVSFEQPPGFARSQIPSLVVAHNFNRPTDSERRPVHHVNGSEIVAPAHRDSARLLARFAVSTALTNDRPSSRGGYIATGSNKPEQRIDVHINLVGLLTQAFGLCPKGGDVQRIHTP